MKIIIYLTFNIFAFGFFMTETANAQLDELYARWPLNEGQGETAFDISGSEMHGRIQNVDKGLGHDGSVWVEDEERGMVASFNGNDSAGAYIEAGVIPAMTMDNDFTWAFWAKVLTSADGAGDNDVIIGNRYGGTQSPLQFIKFTPTKFEYYNGGHVGTLNYGVLNIPPNTGVWMHHAIVKHGMTLIYYRNGVLDSTTMAVNTIDSNPFYIGGDAAGERFTGFISDVQLYTAALTTDEILRVMTLPVGPVIRTSAYGENPSDGEIDVSVNQSLSWTPGYYADTHNLYLGTDYDDVDNAIVPTAAGLDANTYKPIENFEFNTTYYWRVDEINAPPNNSTIFKGKTWQFMTELLSYAIPGDKITVTASSQYEGIGGPEKTKDGSGLTSITHPTDPMDDIHSTDISDMWISNPSDMTPWIQYNFDKLYKINSMLVWNFNAISIWNLLGMKDVTIEYSTNDGTDWQLLENVPEFAKATGKKDYVANTIVPFNNLVVNAIKIKANSNWSYGISNLCGLSEVNFLAIPTYASSPIPENGATDVALDTILNWKAGRETVQHKVYLSTDKAAVASGTISVTTVSQASYLLDDVDLGTTFYWRVDEVNNAETTSIYNGDIWSFETQDHLVVDDFERYVSNLDSFDPLQVYNNWTDGFANPIENGSLLSSTVNAADVLITPKGTGRIHGGTKMALLCYDNNTAPISEVTISTALLPIGSNWSRKGARILVLWFYPDANIGITDRLYVKINNTKVVYNGAIINNQWNQFSIDLTSLNFIQSNVRNFAIGLEPIGAAGSAGQIFLDNIMVYKYDPVAIIEE